MLTQRSSPRVLLPYAPSIPTQRLIPTHLPTLHAIKPYAEADPYAFTKPYAPPSPMRHQATLLIIVSANHRGVGCPIVGGVHHFWGIPSFMGYPIVRGVHHVWGTPSSCDGACFQYQPLRCLLPQCLLPQCLLPWCHFTVLKHFLSYNLSCPMTMSVLPPSLFYDFLCPATAFVL